MLNVRSACPISDAQVYLQRIVEAGFGNRILFGTDQMIWPDAIPAAIETIQKAPFLSDAQERDIQQRNAISRPQARNLMASCLLQNRVELAGE